MSLQIATVLDETANSIMTHDTNLSLLVAIPCVSLFNGKGGKLTFSTRNEKDYNW